MSSTFTPERASPRVIASCPVRLWGVPELVEGVGVNVSFGGMALSLSEVLPVGTLLRISAVLAGEQVDVTAVVVWERDDGALHLIGVKFLRVSDEASSALASFIDDRAAA